MADTILSLFETALCIWIAAIATFVGVGIGIVLMHSDEKYDKYMESLADFLFVKYPIGMFVIFALSQALKFLGM